MTQEELIEKYIKKTGYGMDMWSKEENAVMTTIAEILEESKGMIKTDNSILNRIVENYAEEPFLKADGFDEAIIGFDINSMRLIYSVKKCITILCRDMCEEDAEDYFSFNVSGSYVGEKTPIWCYDNIP
jgi:hypothetical protein